MNNTESIMENEEDPLINWQFENDEKQFVCLFQTQYVIGFSLMNMEWE